MPDPEYVYDPDDWEVTMPWEDRNDLLEDMRWTGPYDQPKMLKTLIHGPDRWVANIVLSWDDEGDPNETELRWYETAEAARKAIADSLAKRPTT
jgi:hypothetical protein